MKNIVYIGNNLSEKSKYVTSISILTKLLIQEKYVVNLFSDKKNKVIRLIDMCFQILKYRNTADIILIDTFSTSNFYFAYITSQLSRVLSLKYIPILRGGDLPNRLDNSIRMSTAIFKNSFRNVAPSNYLKQSFENKGFETVLIPNVLDIDKYNFKERTDIEPKLLYVRAFADIYNPKMAIHVLNKVREIYPKATLCMVGPDRDGSLAGVKELVDTLHLVGAIEFTGVLPKTEWHKKSKDFDIFINTTNFDNTPVSVMEVMALGLPIISTNAGGLPYLLENNHDAILVEKGDVSAMTNAVLNLLDSPKKVEKITKNAREKVEKFDWKHVKDDWNKILRNEYI